MFNQRPITIQSDFPTRIFKKQIFEKCARLKNQLKIIPPISKGFDYDMTIKRKRGEGGEVSLYK